MNAYEVEPKYIPRINQIRNNFHIKILYLWNKFSII